jgi:hypothetical protein
MPDEDVTISSAMTYLASVLELLHDDLNAIHNDLERLNENIERHGISSSLEETMNHMKREETKLL